MPGQTFSEIRSLLVSAGLAPQHRFGQNFLTDLNLMRKLLRAAEPQSADVILEVGPGTGSLTELLLETGACVIAVELDRGLAELLRGRLGRRENFTLIEADILAHKHEINPEVLRLLSENVPGPGGGRKLIANLPYQIATPLIMELLYSDPPFKSLTCTIQKEVGQRLVAELGSEAYGPLSIIAQTLADVSTITTMPPTAFWPVPKVHSVMVRIVPRCDSEIGRADALPFAKIVQRAFRQRRKMLRRSLRDWDIAEPEAVLAEVGVSSDARPEALSPTKWRRLYSLLKRCRSQ